MIAILYTTMGNYLSAIRVDHSKKSDMLDFVRIFSKILLNKFVGTSVILCTKIFALLSTLFPCSNAYCLSLCRIQKDSFCFCARVVCACATVRGMFPN